VTEGYAEEADALEAEEARRSARAVLPFILPTLTFVWMIVRHGPEAARVHTAVGVAVGIALVRLAFLAALFPASRPSPLSRRWRRAFLIGGAWMQSCAFAGIHFAAGPKTPSLELALLTSLATAVCALAILNTISSLMTYLGYLVISLGSIVIVILQTGRPELVPILPAMLFVFSATLTILAFKRNAELREKIMLTLKLRDSALRDALTGLRNRAFVTGFAEQRAGQIVAQHRDGGRRQPTSPSRIALLLVDLDHFKRINDTHGHAAGDHVLSTFANLAQATVRSHDVVSRWGGEEFLIVMDVPSREAADAIAERLRKALATAAIDLPVRGQIRVTCSIGACMFPLDAAHPDELTWQETLELADGALYRAKGSGRNRSVWVDHDPAVSARETLTAMRASVAKAPEQAQTVVTSERPRRAAA
jgi:diguanylate cyclase (GGDEF)-like protein